MYILFCQEIIFIMSNQGFYLRCNMSSIYRNRIHVLKRLTLKLNLSVFDSFFVAKLLHILGLFHIIVWPNSELLSATFTNVFLYVNVILNETRDLKLPVKPERKTFRSESRKKLKREKSVTL